jgi:hypothetical protein
VAFTISASKSIRWQKTTKSKGNLVHQCILLQRSNLQQLNKNVSSSARNPKLAQLEEK